jgi:predicted O-methyltransferase YrrM
MRLLGEHLTKRDVAMAVGGAAIAAACGIAMLPLAPAAAALAVILAGGARWKRLDDRLGELEAELSQIEPMIALSRLVPAKRALPAMRGYAISPDFALFLYELVKDLAPRQIVESGSGVSTLLCAYALEAAGGDGKVLALDHDALFAAKSRATIAKHGLSHRATVVHAPLVATTANGVACTWYAQDALAGLGPIDLVMDDGPPKYVGKNARYASLHLLAPRMSPGAPFVVDYIGDEERALIDRWCRELPFDAEWLETKKGNVILRRRGGA